MTWREVVRKGSHAQFKHPAKPGRVTVPHPKRDLPIKTLKSIERQSGLKLRLTRWPSTWRSSIGTKAATTACLPRDFPALRDGGRHARRSARPGRPRRSPGRGRRRWRRRRKPHVGCSIEARCGRGHLRGARDPGRHRLPRGHLDRAAAKAKARGRDRAPSDMPPGTRRSLDPADRGARLRPKRRMASPAPASSRGRRRRRWPLRQGRRGGRHADDRATIAREARPWPTGTPWSPHRRCGGV